MPTILEHAKRTATRGLAQSSRITIPEALAELALEGPPVPTGWAPLDRLFRRGGIPPGRLLVVGGPPFAGKTTIVCQLALHLAEKCGVDALFQDEGMTQAAVRMGVMLGVNVEDLEGNVTGALGRVSEALGERAVYLWRPDDEGSTLENIVAYVADSKAQEDIWIVVLDSVQTILAGGAQSSENDNPRIAVKRFMSQARKLASKHNLIFVLTSQSNRASYRARKKEDNSIALASFAESAAIEFMADVAIVLNVPDDNEVVKVEVVKNRLKGLKSVGKPTFSVRYDERTGTFLELDAAEVKITEENKVMKDLGDLKSEIVKVLRKHPDSTTRQLRERVGSRPANILAALRSLESDKQVSSSNGARGAVFWRVNF